MGLIRSLARCVLGVKRVSCGFSGTTKVLQQLDIIYRFQFGYLDVCVRACTLWSHLLILFTLVEFFFYFQAVILLTNKALMLQERVLLALENTGLFKNGGLMKDKVSLQFLTLSFNLFI